jgi:hypothetical protein
MKEIPDKLTITVTDSQIRRGIRHSATNCPIALSIREQFPDEDVTVDVFSILIDGKKGFPTFRASLFIRAFDNYGIIPERWLVKPFTFTMKLKPNKP